MNAAPRRQLIERWIHLYLDGELSDDLTQQLERLLDEREDVRQMLATAREERRVLEAQLVDLSGTMDDLLDGRIDEGAIRRFEELESLRPAKTRPSAFTLTPPRSAALIVIGLLIAAGTWGSLLNTRVHPTRTVARANWQGDPPEVRGLPRVGALQPGTGSVDLSVDHDVSVPREGFLSLSYRDGTRVTIEGGSRFSLRLSADARLFILREGRARFEVAPAPLGYRVRTPLVVTEVTGTAFSVEHRGAESSSTGDRVSPQTEVHVQEGRVRFWRARRPGIQLPLSTGEWARIREGHLRTFHGEPSAVAPARGGEPGRPLGELEAHPTPEASSRTKPQAPRRDTERPGKQPAPGQSYDLPPTSGRPSGG